MTEHIALCLLYFLASLTLRAICSADLVVHYPGGRNVTYTTAVYLYYGHPNKESWVKGRAYFWPDNSCDFKQLANENDMSKVMQDRIVLVDLINHDCTFHQLYSNARNAGALALVTITSAHDTPGLWT